MMKRNKKRIQRDELRPEYDFSKLGPFVRGKYYQRLKNGTNLVLLAPDVAKHFRDEQSVNAALRKLISASKKSARKIR
jgi:hypothetical protein